MALEGGEGAGKSTQATLLADEMGALLTREPGGTPTGEQIRTLLLDPALPAISARAEVLLMLAARAQHIAQVVEPALAAGRDVVCDRFSGSTLAYQGYGRGLGVDEISAMSRWALGWPGTRSRRPSGGRHVRGAGAVLRHVGPSTEWRPKEQISLPG